MSGDFSFVNENFDELQSEGSKDNVHQEDIPSKNHTSSADDSSSTDSLTPKDRDEGVAVLHLSNEEPPHSKDLFAPDRSPVPKTKSIVAPSSAVASMNNSNGSEEDDNGADHRSKPSNSSSSKSPKSHHYESLMPRNKANELRHEDDDNVCMDLQIAIVGHEKKVVSKTDSYILYNILTKTIRPRHLFEKSEYIVWRRYRDFEWLHSQFEKMYPTLILPPLPGKQIMRFFDHKNELFLEERQKCLDQFLWRIVSHPYYSYDFNFKMFLTANTEEFAAHVESTTTNNQLMGMVSSSVKMASTTIRLKNPDKNFAHHGKYFQTFSENCGVLDRIETRLTSERAALSSSYEDMSGVAFSWANSESQLCDPIRKLGAIFEANASSLSLLNQSNSSFQLAIRMYQLFSFSGAAAVKRRDALQLEYELACDERDKKRRLHEEAVSAGKTEKVTKLANDLEKVGVVAEHAQDELMKSNEQLRVDIEKWMESKDIQLKEIFRNWTDNYVTFHERMFHEWEELLVVLRNLGQDMTQSLESEHVYEAIQ